MKKIILGLIIFSLLIFSGSAMAQNQDYFQGQIGLDVFGETDSDDLGDADVDTGVSLIGEYKVPVNNSQWSFGGGITYQIEREQDVEILPIEFNTTSFYGLAQYNVSNNSLYFVGKLGYNTLSVDMPVNVSYDENGGIYYGIGAGYTFGENDKYVFETLYSINNGELEIADNETDVEYSKFTMSLGMKF